MIQIIEELFHYFIKKKCPFLAHLDFILVYTLYKNVVESKRFPCITFTFYVAVSLIDIRLLWWMYFCWFFLYFHITLGFCDYSIIILFSSLFDCQYLLIVPCNTMSAIASLQFLLSCRERRAQISQVFLQERSSFSKINEDFN